MAQTNVQKSSKAIYGALGKSDVFYFDPEDLIIADDPDSPVFDKRGLEEPTESFVANVFTYGILEPVLERKNTETGKLEVIAGRRRVKAGRIANERRRAEGLEIVRVPTLIRRSNDQEAATIMAIENEQRKDDTPLNRAEKMRKLLELGVGESELANVFGMSQKSVKNHLSLLDCTAAVRHAVESGKIGAHHGYELSRLDPEEQRETLEKMLEAGEGETGKKRAKKMREARVGKAKPGKKDLAELLEYADAGAEGEWRDAVLATVRYVLGDGPRPEPPKAAKKSRAA